MSAAKPREFNIWDPAYINWNERTEYMRSLAGHIDAGDKIEDLIVKRVAQDTVSVEIRELAASYIKLRNKGARLPNFARWITGMWSANKDYANYLAKEGQKAAKRKIMLSCDMTDILRSADTPHFQSCFKKVDKEFNRDQVHRYEDFSQYQYMPVLIAEECPGIAIAFVDDEKQQMMGRQWMHQAQRKDTGEMVCVLTAGHYGCLDANNLARLMAQRGVRVGFRSHSYSRTPTEHHAPINFVGCFTRRVHHDLDTWSPDPWVDLIKV